MERHISVLQSDVLENVQYSRRLCLRINGIPPVPEGQNESSKSCIEKVKNVFSEWGVDVPDVVIDRARRTSRPRIVQQVVNCSSSHSKIHNLETQSLGL